MRRLTLVAFAVAMASGPAQSQSCHGGGSQPPAATETRTEGRVDPTAQRPVIQTVCPVMRKAVDRTVFAVWEGDAKHTPKKVYFCCPGCVDKFDAHPARYVHRLERMKQAVENAPLVDPEE